MLRHPGHAWGVSDNRSPGVDPAGPAAAQFQVQGAADPVHAQVPGAGAASSPTPSQAESAQTPAPTPQPEVIAVPVKQIRSGPGFVGWVKRILLIVATAYVVLFALVNTEPVEVDFVFRTATVPLVFVLVGTLAVGFLLAWAWLGVRRVNQARVRRANAKAEKKIEQAKARALAQAQKADH